MPEIRKLVQPTDPQDPAVEAQIMEICCRAITEAGGYLVPHPEEHATVVVFGAHQYEVVVRRRR